MVEDDSDTDSSWGSDEFEEDYSEEDSGDEQIVSSYVENGDHSPRPGGHHGGHVQRTSVTSYGLERQGSKEEPKVHMCDIHQWLTNLVIGGLNRRCSDIPTHE